MSVERSTLGGGPFPETTWSLLCDLKDSDGRRRALQQLSQLYWRPVYSFLRQALRLPREDSQDLTQGFFTWLLTADVLEKYDPGQGRLRHFLKGILRNYTRNELAAQRAVKRGGGRAHAQLGDLQLSDLPDSGADSPEDAFDRAWVEELIEQATARVQRQLQDEGRGQYFATYTAYELSPSEARPTYEALAAQLGLSANAVRHQLYKVRERIRAEIRAALRDTVRSDVQLEDEWKELFLG